MSFEVNFDGLVGPTHNYAGLAHGNVHSVTNKSKPSNPRRGCTSRFRQNEVDARFGV